jgi:hypothetical protein
MSVTMPQKWHPVSLVFIPENAGVQRVGRDILSWISRSGQIVIVGGIFGPEKPSRTTLQIRFLSIVIHADASMPVMAPV